MTEPLDLSTSPADAPSLVILTVTTRCNLSCLMCQSPRFPEPPAPKDKVLPFLDRLAAWLPREAQVHLTGGEPLTHPHIVEYVARLTAGGLRPALNTNGALLDVATIGRLEAAGLRDLNISLDGLGPTHDRLRNAPGLFQGVLDIIHYLTNFTGLRVNAVSTINAQNARELPELARRLLAAPRFGGVRLQAVIPTLARPWSDDFFRDDALWPRAEAERADVLAALDEFAALKGAGANIHNELSQFAFWRRYFADPRGFLGGAGCRVADSLLQMAPRGALEFCNHHGVIGSIDDDPRALWRSATAQAARERIARCAMPCNYKVNCCYDIERQAGV